MLIPADNAFGILKESSETPSIDASDGLVQSAVDTVIARYEDQYRKKAEAAQKTMEQRRLNNEVTDTFNSCLTYYRNKIVTLSSMNVHRKQEKNPYAGVHAQAGTIVENKSFAAETLLFIKVLFTIDWGTYRFVPPDLQAGAAQGRWEGAAPVQLLIDDPPSIPLLSSVYARITTGGKVMLNHLPPPLYGVEPDILPHTLYLYGFYKKPQGV